MTERTEILTTMKALKLFGMSAGYDEIVAVVPEARFQRDGEAPARAGQDHWRSPQCRAQRE